MQEHERVLQMETLYYVYSFVICSRNISKLECFLVFTSKGEQHVPASRNILYVLTFTHCVNTFDSSTKMFMLAVAK